MSQVVRSLVLGLAVAISPSLLRAQVAEASAPKASVQKVFADGQAAVQAGNFEAAVTAFRTATELAPDDGRNWHMLGYSLHGAKQLDEALKVHKKAAGFARQAPVATYNIACVYSLKGDADKAFEFLAKAQELGFNDRGQLEGDTDMDNIRADPRFKKLLGLMKFQFQAFTATTPRESARLAYFGGGRSPGQVVIDYAPVPWQDGYGKQIESKAMVGKKWRFGGDFWTTLDNSMALQIGGVEVPAGYWYLTLGMVDGGKIVMGVHDPMVAKKMQLDASACNRLPAGIEVPLAHDKTGASHSKLKVSLKMGEGDANTHGKLKIHFGPHVLHAKVATAMRNK